MDAQDAAIAVLSEQLPGCTISPWTKGSTRILSVAWQGHSVRLVIPTTEAKARDEAAQLARLFHLAQPVDLPTPNVPAPTLPEPAVRAARTPPPSLVSILNLVREALRAAPPDRPRALVQVRFTQAQLRVLVEAVAHAHALDNSETLP